MSDPTAPRPTYDPNELRRCIALCFSVKDLRSLAEDLGATGIGSWDRGIQDASRDVVRHFERLGTLDQLVAKLAEARPLMEWPAPLANAPAPAAAETNPAETNTSEFAPKAEVPPPAEVAPKPAAPPPAGPEPVIRDPFAPAWPGTAASSTTSANRLEGRKLAPMLAGAMVLLTIIAIGIFLAVRVGKDPEPAASEVVAGRPLRTTGPARMAADAMKRSLESLARGCDLQLPPGANVDVSLFSAAYAQCGTRAGIAFPPPGLRIDKPSDATAEPPDAQPNAPAPALPSPQQTNPGRDAQPRPAPAPAPDKAVPSDACVQKCAATKRQCNRGCGAEPTSSSEYDRWQACQTQCLSAASKCQLACQ
ncbi:MAG: hypothetical protein IPM54_34215 [Polyangiaceae bacterium]|nr:hypothetical protein [Polyangiaceae bacterium]